MKKMITSAMLVVALAPGVSQAVTIRGAPDCGNWISLKGDFYNRMWLLGFLSGLAVGAPTAGDPLSKASNDQVFLWMDNWCQANPLKNVSDGAMQLTFELSKRKP